MTNETHRVEPKEAHTHTIIFLHGRDSDSREFADEFFESEASEPANQPRTLLDLFPTIRWVFPNAPDLHSERFDTGMAQWFDMWSVETPGERPDIQQPGLQQSIGQVLSVVKEEESLVPRANIFLCGISQGFATAVATYLAEKRGGFAGLIGLCSWMPFTPERDDLQKLQEMFGNDQAAPAPAPKTSVLLAHSNDDDVVPIRNGRELRDALISLHDLQVEWNEYDDGGHWIHEPQGVDDIADFLHRHMHMEGST